MSRMTYAILVLAATLMMGLAFPIGRIGLDEASPFLLMGIRFVLGGAIMTFAMRKRTQPRTPKQWGQAALIGVLNSAGVMGCAYYSMRWITSGESAILTFVSPLLVIVLSALFAGVRYSARQWIGAAVGLAGVVETFGTGFHVSPGTFIGLLGALFFASATLLTKRWGGGFDSFVLTGYQMLAGGIVLLALSVVSEHPHLTVNGTTIGVLLWLVLISSIGQFSIWFYLLRTTDPARTSAFLFLAPFFGVLGGWALVGEPLHWYVGAGGALICLGIFLVNWRTKPAVRATEAAAKIAGV
ncbi:DMT family transporter [Cohnella zeiphila]|uniref:EamA family transporter n=1 Tax=Cohnella zeiphila TaxID=2761120 RepID=A0A7X0SN13_9BACL|nr:EamA family transporter [Cohnella zeiphila]MBB6733018.1 EamA family transporter [Cohnella zeiphila]